MSVGTEVLGLLGLLQQILANKLTDDFVFAVLGEIKMRVTPVAVATHVLTFSS